MINQLFLGTPMFFGHLHFSIPCSSGWISPRTWRTAIPSRPWPPTRPAAKSRDDNPTSGASWGCETWRWKLSYVYNMYICTYVYIYVYMYICIHICKYVYIMCFYYIDLYTFICFCQIDVKYVKWWIFETPVFRMEEDGMFWQHFAAFLPEVGSEVSCLALRSAEKACREDDEEIALHREAENKEFDVPSTANRA